MPVIGTDTGDVTRSAADGHAGEVLLAPAVARDAARVT
jgi:hypothetical protein